MANRKLKPIDRSKANVEAERGESVITSLFGPNVPEHYIIEGEKHSKGGTPLNLPEQSFIFSNDKDLRIKDREILDMFDMPENKVGYTPAEIAKKYDINKYKEILLNPDADEYEKETAKLMINNMFDKLSALALYQESMKGFPQGIPSITLSFLEKNGITPEQLINVNTSTQQGGIPQAQEGLIISGNPIADYTYNKIIDSTNEATRQFSTYNLTRGPMANDRPAPSTTFKDEQQEDNNEKQKPLYGRKIGEISIPMNADAALFDIIGSAFRRINEARRTSEIAKMYSGEENSVYTQAGYGDYVETGTQYGTFRPTEQVYAVNPQNIISNRTLRRFAKGGPLTEEEKKEILNKIVKSEKDKDRIKFLDAKPSDISSLDDRYVYVWKDDNGNIKISTIRGKVSGVDLTEEQNKALEKYNDKDKNFVRKAYYLSNVYSKAIEDIDKKIEEEKKKPNPDQNKIEELQVLKKLQYTNKVLLDDIATNPDKYNDKDYLINNILSNRSDKIPYNNLLKEIHKKASSDKNIDTSLLLKEEEVGKAQKIYNDESKLRQYGFISAPFGFDEKGMPAHKSPEDAIYGNTTSGYLLVPENIYQRELNEKEYSATPDLDHSKVLSKPEEKQRRFPFFTQDMTTLANMLSENARIKKYLPYQAIPEVFLPEATYLSPERALAANQETTAMLSNVASTLGTPQSYAATASMLAGQQMSANANIISNIHNANVNIANQNDQIRNQILNEASATKAQMMTNLYDKTVIANQQYDNAKRQAMRNIVAAFNQAWTNRGLADTMNKTSDYFSIDPITYTVYFDKDKYRELEAKKQTTSKEELYKSIQEINDMPTLSEDTKKIVIENMVKSYYSKNNISNPQLPYMPYMPQSLYNIND